MGRPRKAPEEKRQQITLRFDPAVIQQLEMQADKSGRSLNKEIEHRVETTVNFDAEGLDLLRRLGTEIVALEQRNKGKRWHANLASWSAIAELLAEGPIYDLRPVNPVDEEAQWEACAPVFKIDQKREELVSQLGELGITVAVERRISGLLRLNNRDQESAAIKAIPSGELKAKAVEYHDALRELDEKHEEALLACREAMQPYWDEEEIGRQLCRDYLHDEAQRKRAAGTPFNHFHLLRQFPPWH